MWSSDSDTYDHKMPDKNLSMVRNLYNDNMLKNNGLTHCGLVMSYGIGDHA